MIHNRTSSYCSLDVLKDPGNLSDMANVQKYDSMLLSWAETASDFIDGFCKRHFYTWEGTKYFNGSGNTLLLPQDILSISAMSLDENGSGQYATPVSVTPPLDIVLNPTYSYPKTYIKLSLNSRVSSFANSIPNSVSITGVWGYGNGLTPTPYTTSGDSVEDNPLTSSALKVTVTQGANFGAGMTLRIGTEQMYVTSTYGNSLTVIRGVNGTVAAQYAQGAAINVCQYNQAVVAACMTQCLIWWKRRESAYAMKTGNTNTGEYEIYKGLDDTIKTLLTTGNLVR
jgi:hypothetical protein